MSAPPHPDTVNPMNPFSPMPSPTGLRILSAALLLSTAGPASAATILTESWTPASPGGFLFGGDIPDESVWFDTRTFSTPITDTFLTDVNVSLEITGGFNGDLSAYLIHSSGFSVLLNRPGKTAVNSTGFNDAGMNVVFDDDGTNPDSHVNFTGGAILGGASWRPDGRLADPNDVLNTDFRDQFLQSFNGTNPNGDWTLVIADNSAGGGVSRVAAWGLQITAVPEPGGAVDTGILLGSVFLIRMRRPLKKR